MTNFIIHILIVTSIFVILAIGFKFFLKLIGSVDFSYIGIVIFGSYAAALLHLHFGWGIVLSLLVAFVIALPFTFLVLYLGTKLSELYFAIGTLTLYVLMYQLAYNLEFLTRGAFGLKGIGRNLFGSIHIDNLYTFFVFIAVVLLIVIIFLTFLKKTYFFRVLEAWGENVYTVQSLGIYAQKYVFALIVITTALAVLGGGIFAFYYRYIDPPSFWMSMLTLLLIITFLSYKYNEIQTVIIGFLIILCYEYLRFFKIVDPTQLGYIREILFTILVACIALYIFQRIQFQRKH